MWYLYEGGCGMGNGLEGWGKFNGREEIGEFLENGEGCGIFGGGFRVREDKCRLVIGGMLWLMNGG